MPNLLLTNSDLVAEVSDVDYIWLSMYTWMLMKANGYVKCNSRQLDKRPLHLIVAKEMGLKLANGDVKADCIDHIDRNKLNCRRDNLRSATRSQSGVNRISQTTSGFRGVSYHPPTRKYQASIWKDRRIRYLGWFEDIMDAARAYDKFAKEIHGEFAVLNFPKEKE